VAARLPAGRTAADLAAAPAGGEQGDLWIKIQADSGFATIGRGALLPPVLSAVFLAQLILRRRRLGTSRPTA